MDSQSRKEWTLTGSKNQEKKIKNFGQADVSDTIMYTTTWMHLKFIICSDVEAPPSSNAMDGTMCLHMCNDSSSTSAK